LAFRREFRMRDSIVAIVESTDHEKNRAFIERLAARLRREPDLFKGIYYKGDLKLMGPKALLFLPENTLADLRKTLGDYQALIRAFSQADNLNLLFETVNQQFRALAETNAQPAKEKTLASALPALQRVVNQASESIQQPVILPAPGVAAL
jgi:hypothetical protein